ncbi:MAG: amidohydrolase [Phycisphaerae bacterium]|nr:amidohydrolase [Phycisphaerae bacterium]
MSMIISLLASLFITADQPAPPDSGRHVFVNARIIPVTQTEIPNGFLLIDNGKIVEFGDMTDWKPSAAPPTIHDCSGQTIMPGLVCTHSHIGIQGRGGGGADRSDPIQPDVRILDTIDIQNSGFRRAVAGGLTCLNIMPGSGHLSSGQTAYVKLRPATRVEDLLILDDENRPMGGLKMANGTNPQRDAPFPGTRGKSASLVRQAFIDAQEYQRKLDEAAADPGKMPERNLRMEALCEVLRGERVVHHHTHRHDDILTVLRLADEFDFRVVLHHVSDGWKIPDEIAEAGAPCSVILVDSPGGKQEAIDISYETGRILDDAGVDVAFHTDDLITDSRWFRRMPALAMRAGMDRQSALESITIKGAMMLDLDDRIGSLEPDKDADFILLDGDPFSIYTTNLQTWVEGRKVFDRSSPSDRLYAVGGPGAGQPLRPYLCCIDEGHHE